MVMVFAVDGISHSTVQNAQNQALLMELFTLIRNLVIPNVTAILKATVTRFQKITFGLGFWIGKCVGVSLGDGYTDWLSMSRIVIEEVPPPQP